MQPRDPERYEIIDEHGRGGLGRVARARDRELGRDVAIKELLSRDLVGEIRFLREALITARLEHPGIVPVHEAGRWPDGTPFYAMKLVSGRPLRDLILERAAVEQRIGLLHHVIAVADAIAYAHDRNIIHRDLKPANVIVGKFGETVVIDWGLAKDLTATELPDDSGGPYRTARNDGLTAVGSVLGTPAYMAPEQRRGEPVDQRADVFAIGAMLWELCCVEKLSTIDPERRQQTLRRAGIDEDLVAIIHKALDPDPACRYRDAGGLAADLKAFESGARIAARRYSLSAMLSHWLRHHRTLALSAAAMAMVALAGVAIYVRNIAAERDRADGAFAHAEAARHDLVREHAELTLKHAQLLLATDPSAATDTLATYQGDDRDRAGQLRAEAIGHGVAIVRAVPHTDNVLWAAGMPDGSIVSLGIDGTIARTSPGQISTVLARDTSRWSTYSHSYAPSRHLLAYFCGTADLCMLDVLRGTRLAAPPEFHDVDLVAVRFSPGGGHLALLFRNAVLQVFDVAVPDRPVKDLEVTTDHGLSVRFVGEDALVVGTPGGIQLVRRDVGVRMLPIPGSDVWDTSASAGGVALVSPQGRAWFVEIDPLRVTLHETLCHDAVTGLRFLPRRQVIAYACQDGTVGTWDVQRGAVTPRTHIEGHADAIEVSAAGDYVLVAGANGTLVVLDLATDLVTSYKGHGFRLMSMSPPTPEYPFFISGDVRGGLRVWPRPGRFARVIANLHEPFMSATFDEHTATVIATTHQPGLTLLSSAGEVRTIEPHVGGAIRIEHAASGNSFATYGFDAVVELWSLPTMSRRQVIDTRHGSVSQLQFVGNTDEFVTAGRDGRLVRWTPAGEPHTIARLPRSVATFALAPATRVAVVSTVDGALWRVAEDGRVLPLETGHLDVTVMRTLPDATSICIGYASGEVIVIDTSSWRQIQLLQAADAVRHIVATPDNRLVVVATNDGVIHAGLRRGGTWLDAAPIWGTLLARARRLALTADGLLVAVCTDGVIRLWSAVRRTWLSIPTGPVDPSTVVVTADGKAGAAFDDAGRIIWLDLEAIRTTMGGVR